ncbi:MULTISPECIES: PilW family protein [Neptuniibacter]|jgi:type IV pilus assembly protein PilW|uniref:PilW family protein n=1 Tax=Neptuniibacter TaxID=459520 RepID=UPI00082A34CD|nr:MULTISPECIES: PilW family protein [Neptuniibacter]MDO6513886.1 PilW family protein [Neptuniibacter sp. 2_MG-2023]MDO6593155.1 PilW family protein [Neptuniibacter sp. 1_MG-2023]
MLVKDRPLEKGFSLIELMIALVLGLFLIGGVISVFMGSSRSFNSNEALSRVQENGRFALELIAQDVRNTGYKGNCFVDALDIIDTSDSDYKADAYDINDPIKGWDDPTGEFFVGDLTDYVAGTDLILVKHAAEDAGAVLSVNVDATDSTFITVGGETPGAILVMSDAAGCDMFQNTAASDTADLQRGTAGQTINNQSVAAKPLSHAYLAGGGTSISLFSSTLFYIGSGLTSSSALRSISYDNGAPNDQELVEGVSDLTITYGIASGAGSTLDYSNTATQVQAAGDWDDVVAVRVTIDVDGDQNISHQFSTTIALRNRLR